MTEPVRVAHALVRAASAFFWTLVRRPTETAPVPAPEPAPHTPPTPLSSGSSTAGIENRCPVCQARFRGSRTCSRCGGDLEPLMRLAVKAWRLRQTAREALEAGDTGRALALAIEAQGVQSTESGEALRLLGAWLRIATIPTQGTS